MFQLMAAIHISVRMCTHTHTHIVILYLCNLKTSAHFFTYTS